MPDVAVAIPARLDALAALRVGAAIATVSGPKIYVDVGGLSVLEPFGMLYVASIVRTLRTNGACFHLVNVDRHCYAEHMGFYSSFEEKYPAPDHNERENERYIAIKALDRAALIEAANAEHAYRLGETIELASFKLARLLTQMRDGPLVDALTYCLREIIRNAQEHSGVEEVLICAQYRPASNRVDIAFADSGRGIRQTVLRNPRVVAETDLEAIKVALMPGISGTDRGQRAYGRSGDPWENSGYGLFMTQRICREGGVFTIASGEALLRLTGERELVRVSGVRVGTVVGLTMRLGELENLQSKLLAQFSAEGGEISKNLKGEKISASTASLTLRMTTDDQGETE